jgi:hypothetical protein
MLNDQMFRQQQQMINNQQNRRAVAGDERSGAVETGQCRLRQPLPVGASEAIPSPDPRESVLSR